MNARLKTGAIGTVAGALIGAAILAAAPAMAQSTTRIVITSQPSGTSQYLWGVQHFQAVAAKTGYNIIIQESSGTEENMFRIEKQKAAQIGTLDGAAIQKRWGNDHGIRQLVNFAPAVWQVMVAADSGIKKLTDLDGKNFNPGPTGGGSTRITVGVLDALKIKPKFLDGTIDDALEAYVDGRIVGLSYRGTGTAPTGGIVEASSSRKVSFVPFTDEEIEAAKKLYPYLTKGYIQPNTYAGQTEAIPTIASWQGGQVGATKDLPEDVAYNFVKAYFEVLPEIGKSHSNIRAVTPENSVEAASTIPLHKGAIRYYREKGIAIPDSAIPPEAR